MVSYSVVFFLLCSSLIFEINAYPRIVGGFETTIEQRPYQASLQFVIEDTHSHGCGASIISKKFLLTAARCNPEHNMKIAYARVGSTMYDRDGQLLKIANFTPHPNYDKNTFDYNFAIISFEDNIEIMLGDSVKPIQLATNDDSPLPDGSMLTISGWGITSENGSVTPFHLREVNLPVYNQEKCENIYDDLTDRKMCLGGTPDGGTGACIFDYGGPAVQDEVLYGIISHGKSCYLPDVPGIYGRVSSVREWIKDMTRV